MNYQLKTLVELKEICKKRKLKGYSKLNKQELIQFIQNNSKKRNTNITKIKKLGWKPKININNGLKIYYEWYLNQLKQAKINLFSGKPKSFLFKFLSEILIFS